MRSIDINRYWYRPTPHLVSYLLLPFSGLFKLITAARRFLYRIGMLKSFQFQTPVIIVGNITVGGTGKTPIVIWLANLLRAQGYSPGIVSRGVGRKTSFAKPHLVSSLDSAATVGDEAVLIYKNTKCPLVVSKDKVAAAQSLLPTCNVIICDDGLQHYRLQRHMEIAIVDGLRRFGNQCLLPAGPLRESQRRLSKTDMVLVNEGESPDEHNFSLAPDAFVSLFDGNVRPTNTFQGKRVHAIAAIGHPERFFKALNRLGLEIIPHVFPDHYLYCAQDFAFADALPIVMTEKDAVKCYQFANERCWYLRSSLQINSNIQNLILNKLNKLRNDL